MKLDAKTAATLTLGDRKDAIFFDDTLIGFGLRLRLAAGGKIQRTWIVQYRHAGCGRRYRIGSAEVIGAEKARDEAKKVLAKVELGQDPQTDRRDRANRDKHSLRDEVEEFLAAKKPDLRPRSLTELRRYLTDKRYFGPLHTLPLDRVTRRDVASRILAITRGSGAATAREARGALSNFYVWAMQMGLAEANPTVGAIQPKTNGPRERVLSDDEIAAIWRACGDDDYGRIVRLLVLTGCRRAEIGDLRWSEFASDLISFTIPANRSKNKRPHTLPVMPMMRAILDAVPKMATRDALFGQRSHGFTAWSWKECKPALDERSGVENWRLHDIRRSVATKMADIGVQPHVIEAALNHQRHKGGIAGVYNRSSYEREVRAALATWHDHLRALLEGGERKVLNFQPAQVGVP